MNVLITPFTYELVTSLLTPILQLWMKKRIWDGKEDPDRISERWGYSDHVRPQGPLIWLHGASVGETQMMRPLIDRLLDADLTRHILVTSGTRTSAELLSTQLPHRAIHQYVPLDTPRATARFMMHWRPDLAVFAESELWPNLVWTTQRAGIPLALINARMSEASLHGWRKRSRLARSVIGAFNIILAADNRTAKGLKEFTVKPVIRTGNLKFDAPPPRPEPDALKALSNAIGERSAWLVASTHHVEETVIQRLREQIDKGLMIWLPRHPERGGEIAAQLNAPLRSRGELPDARNLYVMDTLGEMGLALAVSDVCLMGGSFDESLAGHNPLEAARAGVPVLSGPNVSSFSDLYADMETADAVRISTIEAMPGLINKALAGELSDMAERAKDFAASQTGALDKTVSILEDLLR